MTRGIREDSTPEVVFGGSSRGLELFHAVERLLAAAGPAGAGPAEAVPAGAAGPAGIRASKSQVAFRGKRGFAYMWWPGRYLKSDVPAVLGIALSRRIDSPRFKEVVNPSPGVWMHHLELRSERDLDAEVAGWLGQARAEAG